MLEILVKMMLCLCLRFHLLVVCALAVPNNQPLNVKLRYMTWEQKDNYRRHKYPKVEKLVAKDRF